MPVTLVTGASRGIGKALALHRLSRGDTVVGWSRSAATIEHPEYEHAQVDITDEAAVRQAMLRLGKAHRRLDHLLNNAGVAAMNHALLTPASTVRRVLETNVVGAFLCAREAARLMQAGKFGRVVNLGSVAVPLRVEGEAIYAASKAAVVTLTHVLARELAPLGVTVNAVGPGPVDTDLIRGVPSDRIDALLQRQAIPRKGTPADVANVIDFFLQPASDFVTGQVIYLGGV